MHYIVLKQIEASGAESCPHCRGSLKPAGRPGSRYCADDRLCWRWVAWAEAVS